MARPPRSGSGALPSFAFRFPRFSPDRRAAPRRARRCCVGP